MKPCARMLKVANEGPYASSTCGYEQHKCDGERGTDPEEASSVGRMSKSTGNNSRAAPQDSVHYDAGQKHTHGTRSDNKPSLRVSAKPDSLCMLQ
eukprot:4890957-Amphidinium_carterae.2